VKKQEIVVRLVFLLFSFTLIACITQGGGRRQNEARGTAAEDTPAVSPWSRIPENHAFIIQQRLRPGDPLTVIFYPKDAALKNSGGQDLSGLKAMLYVNKAAKPEEPPQAGKKLSQAAFFDYVLDEEGHTVKAAVLAIPSTADSGGMLIRIEPPPSKNAAALKPFAEIPFTAAERAFASEEIPLNPANTSLRTQPDPQKTTEAQLLLSIINKTGDTVYTEKVFSTPVPANTRRTSFFGDRRVYVYATGKRDTAIHAGIDYGVPTGTKVACPANGRVVLARPRIVTGNSVVLEHLPGLYTIYFHLDKILVEEGTLVKTGDVLAESGSTGLSTGPHLHWEIRAGGENTDPDALTAGALLDKAMITRRLLSP
jgi:murein DD-endopeptidase MepM/ murein hydrolase activator NlpD